MRRYVWLSSVVMAAAPAACSDGAASDRWLVTGRVEKASQIERCRTLDGVEESSFSIERNADGSLKPASVVFNVATRDTANAVIDCVRDEGGTADKQRA